MFARLFQLICRNQQIREFQMGRKVVGLDIDGPVEFIEGGRPLL